MKKKSFYTSILSVLAFCATMLYSPHSYSYTLEFDTSYALYIENGCKPCWDYLVQVSPNDVPLLEEQIKVGMARFLTQSHASDGYNNLSKEQKEENSRIEKLTRLFLDKGIDINYVHDNSFGALLAAVTKGDSNLFAFLVKHGADVNVINYIYGKPTTVLEIAKEQLASATKRKDSRLQKSLSRIIKIIEQNQHNQPRG